MKQKTLGQVAHEASRMKWFKWKDMDDWVSKDYERQARAVVREYEKRRGKCTCMYPEAYKGISGWVFCPMCGKRIKVGK